MPDNNTGAHKIVKLAALFLVFIFMFGGCKMYHKVLESQNYKERGIQATKKGEIADQNGTKVVVTATYLNLYDRTRYVKDESFVLGIYISEPLTNQKKGLNDQRITLLGNKKRPKEVRELRYDDEILKDIPVQNRWSSYYLVDFDRDDKRSFKIDLYFEGYGDISLEFLKDY